MRHHHARHRNRKTAVAQLVQVKHVGLQLFHQRGEIRRGIFEVLLPFLHPVQAERRGTVFQAMQVIHPRSLLGKGDFAETHQSDAQPPAHQPGDQFAGIGPRTTQSVCGNQNVHEFPLGERGSGREKAAPRFILLRYCSAGSTRYAKDFRRQLQVRKILHFGIAPRAGR